jgi:hypothetical protein
MLNAECLMLNAEYFIGIGLIGNARPSLTISQIKPDNDYDKSINLFY